MSLKHVKEALDRLGRTRVDDLGEVDRMLRGARAEVEAIEKAAVALSRSATQPIGADAGAAMGLLDNIAKEIQS